MIPVGENGINNTIIITDGKYNKPSIENVIKINSYNETDLASYREDIYESKSGMRTSVGEIVRMYEEEGILTEYKRSDIWMFEEISSEVKGKNSKNNRSNRNNSGQQNGRGSSGESKRFSLKDSKGNQLTEAQAEFFKDSKVRDENGNLLLMYHGTSNGKFSIFNTYGGNFGLFGRGSYFTANKDVATSYTKKIKEIIHMYIVYI